MMPRVFPIGRKLFHKKLFYFIILCLVSWIIFHLFVVVFHLVPLFHEKCSKTEKIDVVYTWVNGSDPAFLKELKGFLNTNNIPTDEKYLSQRFDDKNELKFSLRSLEKYAPWINHVYIVTNGQIPHWLNLDYEKVTLVTHKEIFLDRNDLPTFSSPAIESHLHRIQGLSKKFLYLNDDIFLGQPVSIDDFITANNGYLLYFSYPLGVCAPHCFWVYVADDQCDEACNNFFCQFDGGDCEKHQGSENNEYGTNSEQLSQNSSFLSKNNRRVQSLSEKVKNKTEFKLTHPQRPQEMSKVQNVSLIVEKYNSRLIQKEKIKRKRFKRKQRKLRVMKNLRNNNTNIGIFNKTNFCAYSASLQHSNRLFNSKYGFMARYVPSHTPVLIDRNILDDLQTKFFKEVMITSRNRFRNHDDLQYSFTYYYYIIHERNEFSMAEVFDEYDTDISGTWSDREIRTLLTRIYQLPLSYAIVDHFESILLNCSEGKQYNKIDTPEFERYSDSRLPTISKELVMECPELQEILKSHFGTTKKYKYQIVKNVGSQYTYFKLLVSNVTDVVGHLDEIRSEPRKFICLNDNLDHTKTSENELISSILYDFYMSFFPFPSKFELPREYRNRFLHIEELTEWKNRHFKIKIFIYLVILFIFYLIGFNVCVKKMCVVVNRLFY